jgi:hypothetical protein
MKAFPISAQSLEKHNGRDLSGMDLRDYFAAKAMQGYMSRTLIDGFDEDVMSEMSYKVADAMMKARDE